MSIVYLQPPSRALTNKKKHKTLFLVLVPKHLVLSEVKYIYNQGEYSVLPTDVLSATAKVGQQ